MNVECLHFLLCDTLVPSFCRKADQNGTCTVYYGDGRRMFIVQVKQDTELDKRTIQL